MYNPKMVEYHLGSIDISQSNDASVPTTTARNNRWEGDLTQRCAVPYGIPAYSINGNDIELMAKATREAANRARAGEGPTLIDAVTDREPHAPVTNYEDIEARTV